MQELIYGFAVGTHTLQSPLAIFIAVGNLQKTPRSASTLPGDFDAAYNRKGPDQIAIATQTLYGLVLTQGQELY